MTKIRSTRLGVLLSITLLTGLGSTAVQAYDPRVTTRPSDLMGSSSPRVVRDHRYPGGVPAGGVTVTATPRNPIVRDHRTPGPIVRDHRGRNGAPQGGVIVTSSTRQRAPTPCIRNILGGPCIGLGGQRAR
jgi:hypothetical protein